MCRSAGMQPGPPTCAAWGTVGCARCTASTPSSSRSGTSSWRPACRGRGSPPPPTTWARGTRSCATPTPGWWRTRCTCWSMASAWSSPGPDHPPAPGVGMNVVMLPPGYPAEMAYFTRALAGAGARVIGVGDQPTHALPEAARSSLAHYEHVNLADEGAVLDTLRGLSRHASLDQV